MGMVNRVHDHAPHFRPSSKPATTARLAQTGVLVLRVTHLPDAGAAAHVHLAGFPGGQPDLGIVPFTGHQLRRRAGSPNHLGAFSFLELNVVYLTAQGDGRQRQAVPRLNISVLSGHDIRTHLEAHRRQDVTLVTIRIMEQCDMG